MAAPGDVSFDVLLGGKVTPELLKSFKDLEELMKKQGATAKTINAVMSRAYKESFDNLGKESKKGFGEVEKSARETFRKVTEQAREAQHKVVESFNKIKDSMEGLKKGAERLFEFTGISTLVGAVGGAIGIEELVRKGVAVHRERATQQETLAATLRGRGRGAEAPEFAQAAEAIAARAHVGHQEAMQMVTKLAASGRFRSAEQAQAMAMSLIGLGGGTAEGAQTTMGAYQRMMLSGQINPRIVAQLGRGSGINVLEQLSRDTGIPVSDLQKQFAAAKVSRRTGEVTGGALAGAKGIDALNKAILELGQSRGAELVQAHMKGMDGLFYRFNEHWQDFTDTIGEFVEKVISPLAEEINRWLDTINFREVFDGMIEKGKEWGQLIKAVWDTIANSPVLNQIKKMWGDFWKTFTGGVELYGPYVETWADQAHTHTVLARHMTDAGKQFVKSTSERIEGFIKGITDAFEWFRNNWKAIADGLWKVAEAFLALKAIEVATTVLKFGEAVGGLVKATMSATTAIGTEAGGGGGLIGALLKIPGAVARIPGAGAIGLVAAAVGLGISEARSAEAWSRTHAGQIIAESQARTAKGGHVESQYNLANFPDSPAMREYAAKHQEATKTTGTLTKTFQDLNDQTKKLTGNDLIHFGAAIDAATQSIMQLNMSMAGFGGGAGAGAPGLGAGGFGLGIGGAGGVSGAHFTEYGPAVAGDQPGQATYDWNSYHHVGAWPGITGALRPGDVALGHGAQAKYHVSPGQMFTDEYGRTWRFADRSGSKDPFNVDVFKGAMGGIFRRPTHALIGESGPEAVLPLGGAGAAAAGVGAVTINVNVAGNAHDPEGIASAVERVMREHWRRSAVV